MASNDVDEVTWRNVRDAWRSVPDHLRRRVPEHFKLVTFPFLLRLAQFLAVLVVSAPSGFRPAALGGGVDVPPLLAVAVVYHALSTVHGPGRGRIECAKRARDAYAKVLAVCSAAKTAPEGEVAVLCRVGIFVQARRLGDEVLDVTQFEDLNVNYDIEVLKYSVRRRDGLADNFDWDARLEELYLEHCGSRVNIVVCALALEAIIRVFDRPKFEIPYQASKKWMDRAVEILRPGSEDNDDDLSLAMELLRVAKLVDLKGFCTRDLMCRYDIIKRLMRSRRPARAIYVCWCVDLLYERCCSLSSNSLPDHIDLIEKGLGLLGVQFRPRCTDDKKDSTAAMLMFYYGYANDSCDAMWCAVQLDNDPWFTATQSALSWISHPSPEERRPSSLHHRVRALVCQWLLAADPAADENKWPLEQARRLIGESKLEPPKSDWFRVADAVCSALDQGGKECLTIIFESVDHADEAKKLFDARRQADELDLVYRAEYKDQDPADIVLHGFKARHAYCKGETKSEEEDTFEKHVEDGSYPSRWISFTSNLHTAIFHALKSPADELRPIVAVDPRHVPLAGAIVPDELKRHTKGKGRFGARVRLDRELGLKPIDGLVPPVAVRRVLDLRSIDGAVLVACKKMTHRLKKSKSDAEFRSQWLAEFARDFKEPFEDGWTSRSN